MRKNVVSTYLSTIQYVPEFCKSQKICDKAVGSCSFIFDSILGLHKT